MRQTLPKGTLIDFSGMLATVVDDKGDDTLLVNYEGEVVKWRWTLEGESCRIVTHEELVDNLKNIFDTIKQQPKRQDSLNAQLSDLIVFANKLGLHDAADYLRTVLLMY